MMARRRRCARLAIDAILQSVAVYSGANASWSSGTVGFGVGHALVVATTTGRGDITGMAASSGSIAILASFTENAARFAIAYLSGADASGTISMTSALGGERAAMAVYALNGPLAVGLVDSASSNASAPSLPVDVRHGGVVVGVATTGNSGGTTTWSGLSTDFNTDQTTGSDRPFSGGFARGFNADQADYPVSLSRSASSATNRGALVASFR